MKRLAWAALMALAITAPAHASDEELTIVNRTGYDIAEIYIAPNATDDWEEDVMGPDVLENGGSVVVDMSQSAHTCDWDVLVTYTDEEQVYWRGLDFCQMSSIALYYDAASGKTWAETD